MADVSIADVLALSRDNRDNGSFGCGGGWVLWIILIFLFFLAFSGNGFGGWGNNCGNNGLAQVERDVLTTSCNTQKEVLESRYTTQLGFQGVQAQMSECCCDIKNAIHAEGEATRALITAQEIQDLRDRLGVANNALTVQTIVSTLRPNAVPAYLTCSPYESAGYNGYGYGYGYGNGYGCNGNCRNCGTY